MMVTVDHNLLDNVECLFFFQPQTQTHCAQRHVKEMEASRPVSVLVNLVSHFIGLQQPLKKT